MRYQIVYDTPGRLRVRCGQYAFSKEQGEAIASLLFSQDGVEEAVTHASNGSILVCYRPGARERLLEVISALRRGELPVEPVPEKKTLDVEFRGKLLRLLIRRALFRLLAPAPVRLVRTFCRACGYWRTGISSLFSGRLGVEVLDAASIGAAILQGSSGTAGSIMFLLSLSELLEEYTRARTKNELARSLAIHVNQVWLVEESGAERPAPLSELQCSQRIRVRAGTLIPVDGLVREGEAVVNEAALTGEPLGAEKRPGCAVYAGTTVEEGSLVVEVTALSSDSRISQIVELIEGAEMLKAGVQSRAERLADAIVPFSFFGALAVGLFTGNLIKALSVLMVDYSCAIKLSTPVAVISAMREASLRKIVVKGGKYLEAFAQADTIVFDKTGTLTAACPKVTRVLAFDGYSEEEVLRISACIEEHFPHSMARAVVNCASERGLSHREEHAEVEYVVAHGVSTLLHGARALIGSYHFIFEDEKTELRPEQRARLERETAGASALYLAIGGRLAGALCISDPPRPEAAETVSALRELGIERVLLLTGDHENAAAAACGQIGITEYRAQVLPEEKARIIESLKAEGHRVIMVGDGINDSPALAAADVSVSLKDASDLAREVADITLLSADLRELVTLRRLSRAMLDRIGRNYRFILQFNTALLLLGLAGILPPTTAALLHNLSTMGVGLGSMRLYLS